MDRGIHIILGFLQKCLFGDAMQNSPLGFKGHKCDRKTVFLKDCTEKIRNQHDNTLLDEYKVILLRASMDPEEDFDESLEICTAHRNLLGKDFWLGINHTFCYHNHPDKHLGPRREKACRTISYDESVSSLKSTFFKLPFGMPICGVCHKYVLTKLEHEVMDSQTTQPTGPIYKATPPDFYNPPTPEEKGDGKVYKPSPDNDNNFESSSELLDKEDADDLMDNPFGFGGKDKAAIKRRNAAFSAFLEACGQDTWIGRLRYENVHFEGSDDSRRGKVLKAAARGIYAILCTVTEIESDRLVIWKYLQKSGHVEKLLDAGVQMSADISEIVKAYNSAPNYKARIQILSAIVKNYKFSHLNKFNKRPEVIEDEDDEESEVLIEADNLYWKIPLTRHIYDAANDHYDKYKHCLEEVVREPIVYWKFKKELVDAIISFVMSPSITQQVAFGTRLISDPLGGKTRVAKVTRRFTNSEVARQIQAYLAEQKFDEPYPCPRTIMLMLENMKASTSKSLEGICPSHELCSRAFDSLMSILKDLKTIPAFYHLLSKEDVDALVKVIETSKTYIKNVFRFQITDAKHTSIRSHCVSLGCSSPHNKHFSSLSDCRPEAFEDTMMQTDDSSSSDDSMFEEEPGDLGASVHDGDGCEFCEAIPTIFKIMTGIVAQMKDHLQPTKYNQIKYNLQQAEYHIHSFKGFIMRSLLSRRQWNEFKKLEGKGQATMLVDFPMRFEPKKFHTTTTEWYGKASFSWFIAVFTRRITVDGKDYFRTTKYICIVDQGLDHDPVKQDQSMVIAIMNKIIHHYKEANADITSLFVKSDNASNFKNESVVSFLKSARYVERSCMKRPLLTRFSVKIIDATKSPSNLDSLTFLAF